MSKKQTTLGDEITEMVIETSADLYNAGIMAKDRFDRISKLTNGEIVTAKEVKSIKK